MARKSAAVARQDVRIEATAAEPAQDGRLALFQIGDNDFAFALNSVAEIVRPPALAHMPLAPDSLLGLANLRGVVLPVLSISRLLGLPANTIDEASRVIVVEGAAPVGFVVDRMIGLLEIPAERIDKDTAGAGLADSDVLDGIVKGASGEPPIKILNPQRVLQDRFSSLDVSRPREALGSAAASAATIRSDVETNAECAFVSFDLGEQEYAVPLESVREVIPLPSSMSEIARSGTAVLGVVTLREHLLPIVSLRTLLGMPDRPHDEASKVVVLSMGQTAFGLVTDRTRDIIRTDPKLVDVAPALLTRGEGDAEVVSICRLDGGKRLIAVLSPERLFRSDLVRRVLDDQSSQPIETKTNGAQTMSDQQFVVFRLGHQEYGLPIAAVDEIARVPEQISKLPKAPAFIDGVMNLRGHVVPIVDLRRRFEIPSEATSDAQRILVLSISGAKTGFLVDAVSEVARMSAAQIQPAPELSKEQMRIINQIANLGDRMILLVESSQLLNRIESDMLAEFDHASARQELQIS